MLRILGAVIAIVGLAISAMKAGFVIAKESRPSSQGHDVSIYVLYEGDAVAGLEWHGPNRKPLVTDTAGLARAPGDWRGDIISLRCKGGARELYHDTLPKDVGRTHYVKLNADPGIACRGASRVADDG